MSKYKLIALIIALAVIAIANTLDMFNDLALDVSMTHLLEEGVIVVFSIGLMGYLIYHLLQQAKVLESLKRELSSTQQLVNEQTEELRQARKEYSQVIKKQFEQWGFSETEKNTAYLLLKGLSLKEVAEVRDIKEKTVRQQASNLYSKANLPGRHALAAWFFEDFL
ncbi:MAG: response regulator transcription factor [Kangiellaceae bacterium]|nr:response regulator transcription factor [Kangiellaceae bacterium]